MSNEIHDTQTPSGAFRRALFDPCFAGDENEDNVTFDDIPLSDVALGNRARADSKALEFGGEDPPSLDRYDSRGPENMSRRPVFSGLVALGVVAGGGTLAALTMLGLLLAGMYVMNVTAEDAPQINSAESGSVDVIRD